jgi:Mg2+/Co2+ transporter CorB
MNSIPLEWLFGALAVLIVLSAFFSSSETALMAINRYRLLHLAREGHRGARLAERLLQHPDRLIGLILLGNNFVNISASAIATIAFVRIAGEAGVLIATVSLTFVLLIFAEVAPKTLAAYRPERIALPASYVLWPLLKISYPVVRVVNWMAGMVLRLVGHRSDSPNDAALSPEELRTLLEEGGRLIPDSHRRMLLNILMLEEARVEDIMVPRNEIRSIDLDSDADTLRKEMAEFPFSRVIVVRGGLDNVVGVLNVRSLLDLRSGTEVSAEIIEARMRKPYYVPEGTRLPQQLVEFQRFQRRSALVVDEYGEILGLVTLADILEEIVGDFITAPKQSSRRLEPQADGSLLIDGRIAVHSLNRRLDWELPTDDANTLSGLIVSKLEALPQTGDELQIEGFQMRMEQVKDNVIRLVRVRPPQPYDDADRA